MVSINITDVAKEKIKQQLQKNSKKYVRLTIKPYGCTGLGYFLEFDNIKENDSIISIDDITFLINDTSIVFFKELTIDYEVNNLKESFIFINPNEKAKCGCGKSFLF